MPGTSKCLINICWMNWFFLLKTLAFFQLKFYNSITSICYRGFWSISLVHLSWFNLPEALESPPALLNLHHVPHPAPDPSHTNHLPLLPFHHLPATSCFMAGPWLSTQYPPLEKDWKCKLDPISLPVHLDLPTYLYWAQVCTNFNDFFYFLDVSEAISPVPS